MLSLTLGDDLILRIGEHSARLTPTEARAFRFLAEHSGEVVERAVLEQDVWGLHPGVTSEAVPVAIRQLRKKFGPHSALLQTVRGVGWRLGGDAGLASQPKLVVDSIQRLIAAIHEAELHEVDALAIRATQLAQQTRPSDEIRCVRAALRRRPDSLIVRLLAARYTDDVEAISQGLAHPSPHVRLCAVRAQRLLRPAELDMDTIAALQSELTGSEQLEMRGLQLTLRLSRQEPGSQEDMAALLEEARQAPALRVRLLVSFGHGLFRRRQFARAALMFDAAIEGADALGVSSLSAQLLAVMTQLHLSLGTDVGALLAMADTLHAEGRLQEADSARGYAAIVLAAAGDWTALHAATESVVGSPTLAAMVRAIADVSRAHRGDEDARARVHSLTPEPFARLGEDLAFSEFLAAWLPRLLDVGDGIAGAWKRIADLPYAADNAEADLIRRHARARV